MHTDSRSFIDTSPLVCVAIVAYTLTILARLVRLLAVFGPAGYVGLVGSTLIRCIGIDQSIARGESRNPALAPSRCRPSSGERSPGGWLVTELPRGLPATLSSWLAGQHPAPSNMSFLIKEALGLAHGAFDLGLHKRKAQQTKQKINRRS